MVKYFNGFRNKYGITQSYKAFTLVELIVVIIILAILGTIAFISLQNYSSSARDSKRLNDVKSLITKISIENTMGGLTACSNYGGMGLISRSVV